MYILILFPLVDEYLFLLPLWFFFGLRAGITGIEMRFLSSGGRGGSGTKNAFDSKFDLDTHCMFVNIEFVFAEKISSAFGFGMEYGCMETIGGIGRLSLRLEIP